MDLGRVKTVNPSPALEPIIQQIGVFIKYQKVLFKTLETVR